MFCVLLRGVEGCFVSFLGVLGVDLCPFWGLRCCVVSFSAGFTGFVVCFFGEVEGLFCVLFRGVDRLCCVLFSRVHGLLLRRQHPANPEVMWASIHL